MGNHCCCDGNDQDWVYDSEIQGFYVAASPEEPLLAPPPVTLSDYLLLFLAAHARESFTLAELKSDKRLVSLRDQDLVQALDHLLYERRIVEHYSESRVSYQFYKQWK